MTFIDHILWCSCPVPVLPEQCVAMHQTRHMTWPRRNDHKIHWNLKRCVLCVLFCFWRLLSRTKLYHFSTTFLLLIWEMNKLMWHRSVMWNAADDYYRYKAGQLPTIHDKCKLSCYGSARCRVRSWGYNRFCVEVLYSLKVIIDDFVVC